MEKIKEVTSLLLQGTITKDDADKILLDLLVVINSWDRKTCKRCGCDLKIECPKCDKDLD
jgi:hypothetical protein